MKKSEKLETAIKEFAETVHKICESEVKEKIQKIADSAKLSEESTKEQLEARRKADEAEARGEFYAIAYRTKNDEHCPKFLFSSKDKEEVILAAKEDAKNGYSDFVDVHDPAGHEIASFKKKELHESSKHDETVEILNAGFDNGYGKKFDLVKMFKKNPGEITLMDLHELAEMMNLSQLFLDFDGSDVDYNVWDDEGNQVPGVKVPIDVTVSIIDY